MKRLLPAAAVLFALAGTARAADANVELFHQANEDYAQQRYETAISRYEQLVRNGFRHENLYYDLGNAYFRSGKLGRAILNYERALRYAPEADDVRYNLEVARESVAARFGKDTVAGAHQDPFWVRAAEWLPLKTLAWGFFLFDIAFFLILILVRFLSNGFLRTGLVVGEVFLGVAGAALGVLLALQLWHLTNVRSAVVVEDEVMTREGPDATRREMFKLHAGHRLVIVKESRGWQLVRLANNVEAWAPPASVEEI